jgi:tRNA(Leu) C34 or U34 (ribose-2'-O)-methylase TrmL
MRRKGTFFAIGTIGTKYHVNATGVVRAARCFGADFAYTVGARYRKHGADVGHDAGIPVVRWADEKALIEGIPSNARLVCVELNKNAEDLRHFQHPARAVYLLGPEDGHIPHYLQNRSLTVQIPTQFCLNVAACANVILYDRLLKETQSPPHPVPYADWQRE